jgi:hypothetical protein
MEDDMTCKRPGIEVCNMYTLRRKDNNRVVVIARYQLDEIGLPAAEVDGIDPSNLAWHAETWMLV